VAKIADYSERLFLFTLCALFVRALLSQVALHPYLILLAISECLPVFLIIIRRPGAMALKPYPYFLALAGTAAPLLVRPSAGGLELIPDYLAGSVIAVGLGLNIFSKIALWRSFGLVAANRGIRAGGPYRFIRHPMYLGYFRTQAAFLLANLTVGNLVKYLLAWSLQILRIREEEKFLLKDSAYRELARRVKFRLVPGLY
jgi:protein-S-isoprenylcysteine O-methyltransferase Ste14